MSSNQSLPPSTDAAAPVAAASTTAPAPSPVRRTGQGLVWAALALAAIALVFTGMLWQKLGFTQQELARRVQDSGAQAVEARTLAAQAEALAQELQGRLTVAEVRLSEVSLQRTQLEELMLALSRSRDDNLVQDLESTVKLAQQQTLLTGSTQPMVAALRAADQRIARAAQPRLNPVQRAIARDIDRIQAAPLADIPSLVLRLDELSRQIDEWPVLNQVGQQKRAPAAGSEPAPQAAIAPATDPASADAISARTNTPEAGTEEGGLSAGWTRVSSWWSALWARTWAEVTRSGRELVRVSRIDRPEAALLAPEQAFFLRENLKLKLLNARLGLLARQWTTSQADLLAVEVAIARYFDTSAPQVVSAQTLVARLRRDLVATDVPRPDETLAALAAAAGGR